MPQIRRASSADLPQLLEWERDPDTAVWLGETGRSWHERALTDADQDHLVMANAGELVGFVVLAGVKRTDGVIELRRMVVRPQLRGAGHGRNLLQAALARAYEGHGARWIWLDVKPGNERALALYERQGFVLTDSGSSAELLIMVHKPGDRPVS